MQFCFVTEADLDRRGVGGVITDLQVLRCLRELGEVDVICLQRIKFRSTPLALVVFGFQILKSLAKPYSAYFSRGLIASLFLSLFDELALGRRKIVHRALSVPFASKEVKFLKFGRVESFIRYALFLWIERFVYSHVDAITVASEIYENELLEGGIQRDRIAVTNFIVDDRFFNSAARCSVGESFRYCYFGGFHLYQDLQPVLEAFEILSKRNPNVELVLIGDGPQRPKLEEEASKRRLTRQVRFLGRVAHESLPSLISSMDCFISLTHKPGLSISVVEAAASAKPIIVFAPKGESTYNNYFHDGKEICIVDSLSPDVIANTMQVLYEDTKLRNSLAQGARKVAERHFSRTVALKQLEMLLQKLN